MQKFFVQTILLLAITSILSGCLKAPPKIETESNQAPKTISPIEELTKDWQQFENQVYSYSIKYPQSWYFHPLAINPPPPRAIFLANVEPGETKGNYASFTVLIDESLGRNLTNHSEVTESIDAGYINTNLEISGSPAVLLVGLNQNRFTASVYVLHGDYFYRLGWQGKDEQSYNQEKETFKQILATFKFLD
jgi:hypothetical protein